MWRSWGYLCVISRMDGVYIHTLWQAFQGFWADGFLGLEHIPFSRPQWLFSVEFGIQRICYRFEFG